MKLGGYYYVIVIEDTKTHQVIASATVIMEQKIIRQCSLVSILYAVRNCEVIRLL